MANNHSSSPGRSVTSKVVSLLDTFSSSAQELSLNALADRSGLPLSTAYRLASELVENGLLERESRGSYRIGCGCGKSARWLPAASPSVT